MSAGEIRHERAGSKALAAISTVLDRRWRRVGARQSVHDAAFATSIAGAFAFPAHAGTIFHVATVVLAANAFVFGVRSTAARTAVLVAALAAFVLASPESTTDLNLGEWPLMILIVVLVAVVADRRDAVARHYESLYRSTARALTRAQEDERRRVSRELHDDVGQSLAALTFTLDAANAALAEGRPSESAKAVGEARRLSAEALAGVRELANDVRPARFDEGGLPAAVTARARRVLPDVDTTVDADRYEPGILTADEESELFHCIQEALLNVARHARARTVRVEIASDQRSARASVVDDGIGFDPASRPRGLGLTGIAERAEILGGTARVESRLGAGTRLTIEMPRVEPRR